MTQPLDPYTLRQAAARWPREHLGPRAAQSFLRELAEDAAAQPATGASLAARAGRTDGEHITVQVFAGRDADHRALCGSLTMRPDEAQTLVALLGEARR